MYKINALLAFSVVKHLSEIIDNKYLIIEQYIRVCKERGIDFLEPKINGLRSNLYKFILFNQAGCDLRRITNETSPVYSYSLGSDPENITTNHVCLPI